MVTATSEMQVVVFDVATRKLLKQVAFPEPGTDGVSIDASGRYAAWGLKSGGMAVMEIDSQKIIAREPSLKARWLAVAPDGRSVAVSYEATLEVRALPSFRPLRTLAGHTGEVTHLAWSPDGTLLASTSQDGRLLVHDAAGKQVFEAKKAEALYAAAFHPGGRAIAFGGHDRKIYERPFPAGEETVLPGNQPYYITCLGYSPDGQTLAVGDESCDVWLFELPARKLAFHGKHHVECWLNSVAWAPDAKTFLFGCRPNSLAGRPSVHRDNTIAEAAQAVSVCKSRESLLATLAGAIEKEKDAEKRKTLQAYREGLAHEGRFGNSHAVGGDGMFAMTGATFAFDSAIPGTPQEDSGFLHLRLKAGKHYGPPLLPAATLPPEVQKIVTEHQAAWKQEMDRLQSTFNCNQFYRK